MQTVTNGTYFQSCLSYYMGSNTFFLFLQTVFMPFYKPDQRVNIASLLVASWRENLTYRVSASSPRRCPQDTSAFLKRPGHLLQNFCPPEDLWHEQDLGRSLLLLQAFCHRLWWEGSGPGQLNLPCSKPCQPWFAFKANGSTLSGILELREHKETQNSESTKKRQQPAGLDCERPQSDGLGKHKTFLLAVKFSLNGLQKHLLEACFSS